MSQPPPSPAYAAAIEALYRRINYEQAPPARYRRRKINLDQMRMLLERLGDPHLRIPAVHIAGTKGKGSTAAMVSSILTRAGYRTGLYTSPHLECLEERYVVDGSRCTPDQLVALAAAVQPFVEEVDQHLAAAGMEHRLTFFEVTTAMAWLHFVQQQVEIAVVEVGLGGRLDSTNLCRPLVTAITSISFDHTRQLGNTLASIAREKAGIIKQAVPVVSGVTHAEPRSVIAEIARSRNAPLYELGSHFACRERPAPVFDQDLPLATWLDYLEPPQISGSEASGCHWENVQVSLIGHHQSANAAVAMAICRRLQESGWGIGESEMRSGLAQVRCAARIEVVRSAPLVILDTAHNVASIQALVATLHDRWPTAPRLIVFAASRDKDVAGMLQHLLPATDTLVCTAFLNNPRAAPPDELVATAQAILDSSPTTLRTRQLVSCATPAEAWQYVASRGRLDELICITGSFFLAAEMRPLVAAAPQVERLLRV